MRYQYTYSTTTTTREVAKNAQLERVFEYPSGAGVKSLTITDELLTTEGATQERAEAELLNFAHRHTSIEFETYYRSVEVGDDISIDSTLYKVVGVQIKIKGAEASTQIKAKRWD